MRYFKLFANWYINIPLTDFWEKVNSVQQLQNEHMWSGTPAKVSTYVTHTENSQKKVWIQIYQLWNLYCNTEESFLRPEICNIFKFCMDALLQIATKKKFCKANFCEHRNVISFNFTNKLGLPRWMFDIMYYFQW